MQPSKSDVVSPEVVPLAMLVTAPHFAEALYSEFLMEQLHTDATIATASGREIEDDNSDDDFAANHTAAAAGDGLVYDPSTMPPPNPPVQHPPFVEELFLLFPIPNNLICNICGCVNVDARIIL